MAYALSDKNNAAPHSLSRGKKEKYDVWSDSNQCWSDNSKSSDYFFQLCVLGYVAIIRSTIEA